MAYSGYLFDLSDSRLTGSGHLDLAALLNCTDLDMIASPYQCVAQDIRTLTVVA